MKEHRFKKRLGQNFLIDKNVSNRIVSLAEITENSLVVEVGPGSGALTELLVKKAQVLAYEIDNDLKEELYSKFLDCDVKFIFDDFLNRDLKKDIENYRYDSIFFVANLPYYITTPIIEKLIESGLTFNKIIVMVQKEVANRFASSGKSKDYSSITVYLNYHFDIKKEFLVSANCFYPKPNVDSAIISFKSKVNPRKATDEELFYKLVKDAFKHKRKNIKNNLLNYDLNIIEEYLKIHNLSLSVRAEQLTLDNFIDIADRLSIKDKRVDF